MSAKARQMRARILHEFNDLIYENGYNDATLRQLAERCGISRGHLYFYFKKKEELQNALSADLYGKIRLIFDDVLDSGCDQLQRFLSLHLLVNYLIAEKRELYRVSAECAEHVEIMDGKAELDLPALYRGLRDAGYTPEPELLKPACVCATSSAYAYIRCLYRSGLPLDYQALFRLFAETLFRLARFPAGETYIDRCLAWFRQQDPARLMEMVYEMDACNYTDTLDETLAP